MTGAPHARPSAPALRGRRVLRSVAGAHRWRLALALGLACTLHLAASPAAAQESDPAHEVGEPLWMTGLSVFTATYVLTGVATTTLVVAANARDGSIAQAWIPLVGPFFMLADSAGFDTTQIVLTGLSAALQVLGCAALVTGIVLDAQPGPSRDAVSLRLAPFVGADGAGGLSLSGSF